MKKKRLDLYWPVLFIFIIALSCICIYGLKEVWNYAEAYEVAQPEKALDPYMETLDRDHFKKLASDVLAKIDTSLQSEDECMDYIMGLIGDNLSYTKAVSSGSTDTITYVVHNDERELGKVTLKKQPHPDYSSFEKFSILNLNNYEVISEEYNFDFIFDANGITVPNDYQVYFQGKQLSDEYITERGIQYPYLKKFYDTYEGLPTLCTYNIDNVFGELTFEVRDRNGNVVDFDENADYDNYLPEVEGATSDEIDGYLNLFVYAYSAFNCNANGAPDENYNNLKGFLVADSPLDQRFIASKENMKEDWQFYHNWSFSVDYLDVHRITQLTDNQYVADITYQVTEISSYQGGQPKVNENSYMVILTNETGAWQVVNFF